MAVPAFLKLRTRTMVNLLPVRAWHPNTASFDPDRLVSPVYDTLNAAEHRRFGEMPHNASNFTSRITEMPVGTFLDHASRCLEKALAEQAFVRDDAPGLYVYSIRYRPSRDILEMIVPENRRPEYLLLGLVGALQLDSKGDESLAPHERTFADRVEERVELTERTGMHFAPIMAGYNPKSHAVNDLIEDYLGLDRRNLAFDAKEPPLTEATLYANVHRLWQISDKSVISKLQGLLKPERAIILDGHHRFAAAWKIHSHGGKIRPLTMFVEGHDKALLLLPWHRYLPPEVLSYDAFEGEAVKAGFRTMEDLGPNAELEKLHGTLRAMRNEGRRGFIAVGKEAAHMVVGDPSEEEGQDYAILHGFLEGRLGLDPEKFSFVRSAVEAAHMARDHGGVAFLLPPLTMKGVEKEAFSKRFMAQKSTMFQPKVAEGVVFAKADGS